MKSVKSLKATAAINALNLNGNTMNISFTKTLILLTCSAPLFGCTEAKNEKIKLDDGPSGNESLTQYPSTTTLTEAEVRLKIPSDENLSLLAKKIGLQESLVYITKTEDNSELTFYFPDTKTDSVYGSDIYSGWIQEEYLVPAYHEYSKAYYRSAKYQFVVDCKKEKFTIRSQSKFSGNLLSGKTITTSTIGEYESIPTMRIANPVKVSYSCLKAICLNSNDWLFDSEQFRPKLCDDTLENNQCIYDWIEE